jgi:cell volume regulation protein A
VNPTPALQVAQDLLLMCALVLAVGAFSGFIARKIGVPDIVLFLLIGMGLGPDALGLVTIGAESAASQLLLLFGASYILFDGGAALRFKVLKEVWITIIVIATLGVIITAAVTAFAAEMLMGLPFMTALLLGAVIASTDPATLVPIFRQVKIKDRVMQTVIAESALNDAMGAILTFTVLGVAASGVETFSPAGSVVDLLREAGLGLFTGGIVGLVGLFLVMHPRWGVWSQYPPLVTVIVVIAAYLAAQVAHGSGFMAVFTAGLIFGNAESFGQRLNHAAQEKLEDFIATVALIMRMFIFILLGAQVNFHLLAEVWQGAACVVLVFMFVARPLTVFLCAGADRRAQWSMRELLFMSWTRETGVIPAALAGMLVGAGVPGAETVAGVTFMAVLLTILIQAPTTKWLAKRLNLLIA